MRRLCGRSLYAHITTISSRSHDVYLARCLSFLGSILLDFFSIHVGDLEGSFAVGGAGLRPPEENIRFKHFEIGRVGKGGLRQFTVPPADVLGR